ncbi:hypothetical protein B0H67DRAFT_98126 [Lasiosphaeris hirsuta]|uniref:Uncharacterized protein n=1 Tax=Lasiosphaeris hirsuta TaxID=260670 RepID=A0AA40DFM8_9PEZI|nr:hypothetical protein B0H67DRAFT_98126 [Lasiosphaeris hirsuta]
MHHCGLLDNSVALQHRILAGIAARVQRTCALRDGFRNKLEPLYTRQSTWWNLTWEDRTKTTVVNFITFPNISKIYVDLQNASTTLKTTID